MYIKIREGEIFKVYEQNAEFLDSNLLEFGKVTKADKLYSFEMTKKN